MPSTSPLSLTVFVTIIAAFGVAFVVETVTVTSLLVVKVATITVVVNAADVVALVMLLVANPRNLTKSSHSGIAHGTRMEHLPFYWVSCGRQCC